MWKHHAAAEVRCPAYDEARACSRECWQKKKRKSWSPNGFHQDYIHDTIAEWQRCNIDVLLCPMIGPAFNFLYCGKNSRTVVDWTIGLCVVSAFKRCHLLKTGFTVKPPVSEWSDWPRPLFSCQPARCRLNDHDLQPPQLPRGKRPRVHSDCRGRGEAQELHRRLSRSLRPTVQRGETCVSQMKDEDTLSLRLVDSVG